MAILISSLQMTDEFLNFGEKAHERDDGTGNVRLKMSAVQLGNDQHDRMTAPYGLSRPYGDEDPSKRNLELIVHDPEMLNKFHELDAHIPTVYEDKSRSWFKKTKKPEYKPLLKETEHGTVVTVKVYCPCSPFTKLGNGTSVTYQENRYVRYIPVISVTSDT